MDTYDLPVNGEDVPWKKWIL